MSENDYKNISITSFLILYAQYLESKKPNGIIHDNKVIEIVENSDFNFSQFEISSDDILDVATRKNHINNLISKFIKKNPNGIVINLGCGLDTYSENYKNTPIIWYDLDLSEIIQLKKKYFVESSKYHLISKSVLDFSWMESIPQDKNTLIIMEGLLPYFQEDEVKKLLKKTITTFKNCDLIIHAITSWAQKHKHRDLKKKSLNLNWGIKTGKDIIKWLPSMTVNDEFFIYNHNRDKMSLKRKFYTLFPFYKKQNMILYLTRKEKNKFAFPA